MGTEGGTTDPIDYGMKKYTDQEIANHSVMISGIPKDLPNEEVEKKIS